jgi:hypothetical protein
MTFGVEIEMKLRSISEFVNWTFPELSLKGWCLNGPKARDRAEPRKAGAPSKPQHLHWIKNQYQPNPLRWCSTLTPSTPFSFPFLWIFPWISIPRRILIKLHHKWKLFQYATRVRVYKTPLQLLSWFLK